MTKAQCDPNVANNSGQTPLHHAEYLVLRVSFCVGNVGHIIQIIRFMMFPFYFGLSVIYEILAMIETHNYLIAMLSCDQHTEE